MTDTTALSAADLREATGEGRLSAMEVAEAFLARIAAEEPGIGAWAYHDPDGVREEARKLDEVRASGQPLGPLHAVPVGLKDIIDTQRMPTENGTVIDKGRVPENDAAVVRRLKEAGALIMGKTVTTELAFYHPAGTRNPHDPTRTPGGSSSGSAAAVAARMVPLAVGTQTNGSVIRPASFCGVVGFKPSFGTIARSGILTQSPPLDQVGVFANCIADAACLSEVLAGYDPADPWSRQGPRGGMVEVATAPVPVKPHFAFVKTPVWDKATSETQEAFGELASMLAGGCEEVPLSKHFDEAWPALGKLMSAGFAHNLKRYYQHGREALSPIMRQTIEDGGKVTAVEWQESLLWQKALRGGLKEVFEHFDAIITPAAPGEAPQGLEATGDPSFCTLWTFCGMPAVSLPLAAGSTGLPLGVQLVGPLGDDARLLRTARWLTDFVNEGAAG